MAHSIGKTIAELRKAKGWTQVELAEKLGVSDKAVSKWESEGGFPEITQFPTLASIFGVSIDYIMTGKKEEPSISLDDMDSKKRMFYLIERDDVDNYLKYGYEKDTAKKLSSLCDKAASALSRLESAVTSAEKCRTAEEKANSYEKNVRRIMTELRSYVDEMEKKTSKEFWPHPTYADILYY